MIYLALTVFLLSAAIGFSFYFSVWPKAPNLFNQQETDTPRLIALTDIRKSHAITFIIVSACILFLLSIGRFAEPGTFLWKFYFVLHLPILSHLFLGLAFGFLFAHWITYLAQPKLLTDVTTRVAHRRWGFVVLTIGIIAIFSHAIDNLLHRLQSVSTPALGLSVNLGNSTAGNRSRTIVTPNGSSEGSELPSLSASRTYLDAFQNINKHIKDDKEYITVFRVPSEDNKKAYDKNVKLRHGYLSSVFTGPTKKIAKCMNNVYSTIPDPAYVHNHLAQSLYKIANKNVTVGADGIPIGQDEDEENNIMGNCTLNRISEEEVPRWATPYLQMAVAFMAGSAGAHETAAALLARWIDKFEEMREERPKLSKWYKVRAQIYLDIALDQLDLELARYDVLLRNIKTMEGLFANARDRHKVLRDREIWSDECNEFTQKEVRLVFSYLNQINRLLGVAVETDNVDEYVLSKGEFISKFGKCIYDRALSERRSLQFHGHFLGNYAMALIDFANRHVDSEQNASVKEIKMYQKAERYLLDAISINARYIDLGRKEGASSYTKIVSQSNAVRIRRNQYERTLDALTRYLLQVR